MACSMCAYWCRTTVHNSNYHNSNGNNLSKTNKRNQSLINGIRVLFNSRRINIYVYQGKFHLVFWILYKCCLHIKSDRTIVLLKLRHHILYKIDLYLMLTTPRFFCCVSYLLMILLLESKETTKNQDSSEIGFI